MANLKCTCGCEEFVQNEISSVTWAISEEGYWLALGREFIEADGSIVCSECGAEYYYDGESLIAIGGE